MKGALVSRTFRLGRDSNGRPVNATWSAWEDDPVSAVMDAYDAGALWIEVDWEAEPTGGTP